MTTYEEFVERHLGKCERCEGIEWSILTFAIPLKDHGDCLGCVCNTCGALHVKDSGGAFGLLCSPPAGTGEGAG